MAFTVDMGTDIGKVRLLIHDLDSTKPLFPDDNQIQALLDLEGSNVKMGAALALETIAGNRALILQVIQILDLRTDGQKTAQALLATAKQLRETADSAETDWAGFEIAEVTDSEFARREKIYKDLEAQGI